MQLTRTVASRSKLGAGFNHAGFTRIKRKNVAMMFDPEKFGYQPTSGLH